MVKVSGIFVFTGGLLESIQQSLEAGVGGLRLVILREASRHHLLPESLGFLAFSQDTSNFLFLSHGAL